MPWVCFHGETRLQKNPIGHIGELPYTGKIEEFPDASYLMQRPCSTANMAAPGRVRVPILS